VWEVLTPDPSQRTLSMGLEVMAGAPVLLMHCATQKPLVVSGARAAGRAPRPGLAGQGPVEARGCSWAAAALQLCGCSGAAAAL